MISVNVFFILSFARGVIKRCSNNGLKYRPAIKTANPYFSLVPFNISGYRPSYLLLKYDI